MTDDVTDFFKKYELLRSTADLIATKPKDRVCRYCQLNRPEVRFRQTPHLVPELLGRNEHLAYDECDSCNGLFSRYEKDLSTFLLAYRAMVGIRGKRGFPQFHSRQIPGIGHSRLEAGHDPGTGLQITVRTPSDFVVNHEERTGKVKFRVPQFIPLHVYKALLKIGLGLLPPKHIEAHRNSFDWLMGKQVELPLSPLVLITPIYRRYFKVPSAHLFRAKELVVADTEYPECTLVVEAANVVIQIFLPFTADLISVHQQHRTLALAAYPGFARDELVPGSCWELKLHDLSVNNPVTYDVVRDFAFDSIDREEY
jgi:hypothetical protein